MSSRFHAEARSNGTHIEQHVKVKGQLWEVKSFLSFKLWDPRTELRSSALVARALPPDHFTSPVVFVGSVSRNERAKTCLEDKC